MNLSIWIRSVLISFLVAVPAPFVTQWVGQLLGWSSDVVIFVCVYVLAFIGCLVMGFCGGKEAGRSASNPPVSRPSASRKSASGRSNDENREAGTVKWFNVSKGFGFITRDTGEDVFVHYRSIRGSGRRILSEGQQVRFAVVRGEKGLQAEDVTAD